MPKFITEVVSARTLALSARVGPAPEPPRADVDVNGGKYLCAPEDKREGNRPGMPGDGERRKIECGERDDTANQRPGPADNTLPTVERTGISDAERAMALAFLDHGHTGDRREEAELQR